MAETFPRDVCIPLMFTTIHVNTNGEIPISLAVIENFDLDGEAEESLRAWIFATMIPKTLHLYYYEVQVIEVKHLVSIGLAHVSYLSFRG